MENSNLKSCFTNETLNSIKDNSISFFTNNIISVGVMILGIILGSLIETQANVKGATLNTLFLAAVLIYTFNFNYIAILSTFAFLLVIFGDKMSNLIASIIQSFYDLLLTIRLYIWKLFNVFKIDINFQEPLSNLSYDPYDISTKYNNSESQNPHSLIHTLNKQGQLRRFDNGTSQTTTKFNKDNGAAYVPSYEDQVMLSQKTITNTNFEYHTPDDCLNYSRF